MFRCYIRSGKAAKTLKRRLADDVSSAADREFEPVERPTHDFECLKHKSARLVDLSSHFSNRYDSGEPNLKCGDANAFVWNVRLAGIGW
jgi:hypothetical protein